MDSLDPLLKQFFAQAKAISLTPQEAGQVWSGISEFLSESLVRDANPQCLSEHMTHSTHSFSKDGQRISLNEAENIRLQKAISSFVASHPVRVKEAMHHKGQFSLEDLRESIVSFLSPLRPMPVIAAIAALFVSLGGVSYAAESTVPGDFLYPVKIHVNENVNAAFRVSDESKADFYADLVEERAEEAQKLAAEGRLDVDTRVQLEEKFSLSLKKAQDRIEDLSAKGNTQAALQLSSHLEGQLEGYALALRALNDADTSTETAAFISILEDKHKNAVEARTKAEVNVSASTDVNMEADARARIAEVKKDLASVKTGTDAAAAAQLKVATDLLLKAEADLDAGTYQKALLTAENADRHTQKAVIFSTVTSGLHLGKKNHSSSTSSMTSSSQNSSVSTSSTSSAQSSSSVSSSSSSTQNTSSSVAASSQSSTQGNSININGDVKVKLDSKVKVKTGL